MAASLGRSAQGLPTGRQGSVHKQSLRPPIQHVNQLRRIHVQMVHAAAPGSEPSKASTTTTVLEPAAEQPVNTTQEVVAGDRADRTGSASTSTSTSSAPPAELEERRKRLWKAAIKIPMYSVGYIPVLVGGAAVFAELGTAPWLRVLGFAASAICVIAWLNLSNDAFDAGTGVDKTKPESVVNLTGNWNLVFWLSIAFLAVGLTGLWSLTTATGDVRVLQMLAFSIACGYVYQGPPFRLSYKGLGEPLCFFAFGPSATPAFYLALQPIKAAAAAASATATGASGSAAAAAGAGVAAVTAGAAVVAAKAITPLVWGLSVIVGASTSIILFTSHFHQIEGDKAAGKQSPLVKLGVEKGLQVLKASVFGVYGLMGAMVAAQVMPWPAALATAASLPAAKEFLDFAEENRKVPAKIAPLKRFGCHWHIALGCSLAVGLVAGKAAGLA